MVVELDNIDIVFIYGEFKKQLSKIDKIASSKDCPFAKSTIREQKAPYLSIVEKLSSQFPNLKQMDNCF